jgi:hypothetical protein
MATALKRRLAPSVPFTLDVAEDGGGRLKLDFHLAFDFNAMAQVEEVLGKDKNGKPVFSMLDGSIWEKPTAAVLSVMFWASLLAHQPEYEGLEGLAIVRSYMGPDNAAEITNAVMKAFVASLPPEQQEAILNRGNPTNPAGNGARPAIVNQAGSSSGPSPVTISDSPSPSSAP